MTYLDEHRIQMARMAGGTADSNCISIARYLAGLQSSFEPSIDGFYEYDALKGLREVPVPSVGGIVAWIFDMGLRRSVHHMAVIKSVHPLRLIHKSGPRGNFFDDACLEDVAGRYLQRNYKVSFYEPQSKV